MGRARGSATNATLRRPSPQQRQQILGAPLASVRRRLQSSHQCGAASVSQPMVPPVPLECPAACPASAPRAERAAQRVDTSRGDDERTARSADAYLLFMALFNAGSRRHLSQEGALPLGAESEHCPGPRGAHGRGLSFEPKRATGGGAASRHTHASACGATSEKKTPGLLSPTYGSGGEQQG